MLCIRAKMVRVEQDNLHCLSCTKSAGRFSQLATLNCIGYMYSVLHWVIGHLG